MKFKNNFKTSLTSLFLKKMNTSIICLGFSSCLLFSLNGFSQEVWGQGGGTSYSMPSIEAGFRWGSADIKNTDSNKQVLGFQLGASTVFNFNPNFGLKTGLFYTERAFKSEVNSSEIEGKITYFDVPLFLMYKFEEYAGIYVGPTISVKLGDEVKDTLVGVDYKLQDIKGIITPITLGAQFKIAPQFGLNVYFETLPGELAKEINNSRAVGVNFMFMLD